MFVSKILTLSCTTTLHRHIKHICRYCLECLTTEKISERHVND